MVSIEAVAVAAVGEQAMNPWQGEHGQIFEWPESTILRIEYAPCHVHVLCNCRAVRSNPQCYPSLAQLPKTIPVSLIICAKSPLATVICDVLQKLQYKRRDKTKGIGLPS